MLRNLIDERKYRKKYNALKIVHEDTLIERDILIRENEVLRKELTKLIKERNGISGRNTKQKLSNNKGLNVANRSRQTSSKKDNGTSNSSSKATKLLATTN